MVIKTLDFKKACQTILAATDTSELSTVSETLELQCANKALYMKVTNGEYVALVKFDLDHDEDFHASVNANLFLKLITAITSENIEMNILENGLEIKANGTYKIPFCMEGDDMIKVPMININNVTVEMDISSSVLESIVNFNSKQLNIGSAAKPVQKMFYLDNEGCITFTTGACVNTFELPSPVKVLLNSRLVNLFKLFKGEMVHFSLGYDAVSETIVQTKVCFETENIMLVAVTGCDDSLLAQVPAEAIRGRANKVYPSAVVLNVAATSEAIKRLLLFSAGYGSKESLKPYSKFVFSNNSVAVYDSKNENEEILAYQNGTTLAEPYEMTLDLTELAKVIEGCSEQYITLNFGDPKCCVVARGTIKNVIPVVTMH